MNVARTVARVGFGAVMLLAFFAPATVRAVNLEPLTVTAWSFDGGTPERPPTGEPCATFTVDRIDYEWGGDIVAGCAYDRVVVHVAGVIVIPEPALVGVWHDDGAAVVLDGVPVIDAWWDTGCVLDSAPVSAGVYMLDAWFYENGGGACFRLVSSPDGEWFTPIPPEQFTTSTTSTTTTTTSTTSTTTTTAAPTTTEQAAPSTTTEAPTTTTRTEPPTTAPSNGPAPSPPSNTTSTTPPASTTTSPAITSTTTTTVPATESTGGPTTPPTTVLETTVPVTADSTPVDAAAITAEVAALTADDFAALTDEEVADIVADIAAAELTAEQSAAIAVALADAPDDVKAAFEDAVNVYGEGFELYVPEGSTVTVAVRRTIVAAAAALQFTPALISKGRRP